MNKTKAIGVATALAVVTLVFAYPAIAAFASQPVASNTTASTSTASTPISIGQTITLTSFKGSWKMVGADQKGVAAGAVTLTVTGSFKAGYALSVTSGSLTFNGATYSISGGSAEMGPYEAHLVGQGTLSGGSTPGAFLMSGAAHATILGQTWDTLRFDVQADGAEYGVVLQVTAS